MRDMTADNLKGIITESVERVATYSFASAQAHSDINREHHRSLARAAAIEIQMAAAEMHRRLTEDE